MEGDGSRSPPDRKRVGDCEEDGRLSCRADMPRMRLLYRAVSKKQDEELTCESKTKPVSR